MEALLVLEDGRAFRGRSFGATGERAGEVVFNTSMTGYQEILTDPSYRGQLVTMTCPEIGNYGTNELDAESARAQAAGFVVRRVAERSSNWRTTQELAQFLRQHEVPGLTEVDTRAITRHIRSKGAMRAVLSTVDRDVESLAAKARRAPRLGEQSLVAAVTCAEPHGWTEGRDPRWGGGAERPRPVLRCVAYDFGVKRNILRLLHERGFELTVVPADHDAEATLALRPDAVFLSNGPGDPTEPTRSIEAIRRLIGRVPVFGICLGHQLSALALGASTFKLKFGHRGANHPVRDERSGRIAITSQNHGYAVDPDSLPAGASVTHVNLNDGTCEGFVDLERRLFAVQYHPESSPGPHDAHDLFDEFRMLAVDGDVRAAAGGTR